MTDPTPGPVDGILSKTILQALQMGGPQTAEQLAHRCGLPTPHIRAALSEMCFESRAVTSDGRKFSAGPPPKSWPQPKH